MADRIPVGETGQSYQGQILGTDENGYVRKIRADIDGDLMVELGESSVSYADKDGRENFNGIFGEKYVSLRKPKFSFNFNYPADTRKVIVTQINGGTSTYVNSLLTEQTGTNIAGKAVWQTKSSLRYSAGRDAEIMFTALFTAGVANSSQRIGLFDDLDGLWVGFNGVDFGVSVRRDSVDGFVAQSNFSEDKLNGTGASGFTLDKTKLNIYRIVYGYLGVAPVYYSIFGGEEHGWVTFHIHNVANKVVSTYIKKPYLPIRSEVINSGNNTNLKMQHGSFYAGVIDGINSPDKSSRQFSAQVTKAIPISTNAVIGIFHNKPIFQTVVNNIEAKLLKIGIGVDGTKTSTISLYKLSAIPTGTTFVDVDTTNSTMELSSVGTISLVGAMLLDSWALGKTDSVNTLVFEVDYTLLPDEYAVFTFTSTGASDVSFINRWSELF